jgi:hypothetical protein
MRQLAVKVEVRVAEERVLAGSWVFRLGRFRVF